MLDEHYQLHKWDAKTSLQTREGLLEIGLPEVADKLDRAMKLL
jgi:hypothetical protein